MLTPQQTDLLRAAIDQELVELHTCLPGRIESYDESTGLAQVKPLLMRKLVGKAQPVEMQVISGVPVWQPRSGNAFVKLPIAAGTLCMLIFAERSLDRWLSSDGGPTDPGMPMKHHINDAIAVPGLYPKSSPVPANGAAGSVEMANGTTYIEITSGGKVKINSTGNVEVTAGGDAKVNATGKMVLTSTNVNLGDETGEALALKSDLAKMVITAPNGPCTIVTTACIGTLKTKAK
jgi:hypothetical protein